MKRKIVLTIIISLLIIIFSVGIGSVFVPPDDIIMIIFHKLFSLKLPDGFNQNNISIIWELRLPRVLLAFFTGAALSSCGAVTQSVLKNPLASPFTLGVSSGASLGAAIVLASGISISVLRNFTLPAVGLVFGVIAVFLAVTLASKLDKNLQSATIILTGMVFSLFISGIVTIIAGLSKEKYEIIMRWQTGTFSAKGWDYVKILLPVLIIGICIFIYFSRELDILTFGEEQASAMGVETKRIKWLLLIVTAVLTGVSVSFAGIIGFIDLIAPHVARKLFSSKHNAVIPISALIGGMLMTVADLLSRTLTSPKELPVSAVTALIGAPFFVFIFFKRRKSVD